MTLGNDIRNGIDFAHHHIDLTLKRIADEPGAQRFDRVTRATELLIDAQTHLIEARMAIGRDPG